MREVVQASREFQRVRPLLAAPEPADCWKADMLHHFVYSLQSTLAGETVQAYFVMSWDQDEPLTAVIVVGDPDGAAWRTEDLRTAGAPAS